MFPKKGNNVPKFRAAPCARYSQAIAAALRSELGSSNRATKTLMRWTGASDRSAKNWLSGLRGPSGWHLILIAGESDAVLITMLELASREKLTLGVQLAALKRTLLTTAQSIDDVLE